MTSNDVVLVPTPNWNDIRYPSPEDPTERLLDNANRRGRRAALRAYQRVMPWLPLEELSQTTDGATLKVGSSAALTIDQAEIEERIDRFMSTRSFAPGVAVKFVRERSNAEATDVMQPDPSAIGRPMMVAGRVAQLLDEGYTAVFDGLDLRTKATMRSAEAMERIFSTEVNVNGYLSLRPPVSFGSHWDNHEVLIVQLLGRKHWQVEEPIGLSMDKSSHGPATSERIVWKGDLEPGVAMYIPRGWGHRVNGLDELTFHCTISIPRTTGIRVLQLALERQRATGADGRIVHDPRSGPTLPITASSRLIDDAVVAWAVAQARAGVPSRSTQQLSTLLEYLAGRRDGLSVRCPLSSGWFVRDDHERRICVAAAGRQYEVTDRGFTAIAEFGDGVSRPLADVPADLRRTVEQLVRLGIIDVDEGEGEVPTLEF